MSYLKHIILSSILLLSILQSTIYVNNINSSAIVSKDTKPTTSSSSTTPQAYDKLKNCAHDQTNTTNALTYLIHFNCGHDIKYLKNGTTFRNFTLIVMENVSIPIASNGLIFNAWTYNGSIPGPTMRMTEGDHIQINLINLKTNNFSHSLHMHSIHAGNVDGVPGLSGDSGSLKPGQSFTYSFTAKPFGVYPYHCHVSPIDLHISNGLYGMMIIDPKTPRAHMTEMVMMMNGYNLQYEGTSKIPTPEQLKSGDFAEPDNNNQVYTVNGKAFIYTDHPINLTEGQQYRIYLVNMLEFDPLNNFHLHGTLFNYYPSGTSTTPTFKNDIVDMMQGDRGILEFKFDLPGQFMFHAHKTEFTDLGWMGTFNVIKSLDDSNSTKKK
jgi:manganese oxidase